MHCVHGIHVAVPAGSPCFAAPSLGEVARQISDHEHRPRPVTAPTSPRNPMDPPGPHPPLSPSGRSPAQIADDLARQLAGHGITGIYTATTAKFAVISVTAELTVWTNGQHLWCNRHGQRHTWPASDMQAAAAGIAALARS